MTSCGRMPTATPLPKSFAARSTWATSPTWARWKRTLRERIESCASCWTTSPAPSICRPGEVPTPSPRRCTRSRRSMPDQMDKVSQKAIVYIILDQDETFRKYIEPNWPKLQVLGSFRQFGVLAYSMGEPDPLSAQGALRAAVDGRQYHGRPRTAGRRL